MAGRGDLVVATRCVDRFAHFVMGWFGQRTMHARMGRLGPRLTQAAGWAGHTGWTKGILLVF